MSESVHHSDNAYTSVKALRSFVGEAASWEWSIDVTRKVWAPYRDAVFRRARVNPRDVLALGRFVEAPRVSRAYVALDAMRASAVRLFEAVVFESEAALQVVFPPIAERAAGGYVLIHGSHRLHVAQAEPSVELLLAEGALLPDLPTAPIPWSQVQVAPGPVDRREKFGDYDEDLFRPGPEILHGPHWRFKTVDDLLAAAETAGSER